MPIAFQACASLLGSNGKADIRGRLLWIKTGNSYEFLPTDGFRQINLTLWVRSGGFSEAVGETQSRLQRCGVDSWPWSQGMRVRTGELRAKAPVTNAAFEVEQQDICLVWNSNER